MATDRMRLGVLVASPNFRHPVPFAKELVALDDIARGRLTVGLGAGSPGWDATMLGQPKYSPRQRTERFEEFVHLLDLLLRRPATSFAGKHYTADEARTYPGCVQEPRLPFAVAATGPRGMRLAATYGDIWVTTGDRRRTGIRAAAEGAQEIRGQIALLDRACAQVGRDPGSLRRLVVTGPLLDPGLTSVDAFAETTARYREAGVTDLVVHWPRREGPYAGDLATFERIVAARAASAPNANRGDQGVR
jgi:alkanesulfonate monooxygenase SsuD/methylene tetrahydromethanopterin reductase-like flavin-dependent oxidoreductase (luciferase family)